MNPAQCRRAREILGWSPRDLAEAAAVPLDIVEMFEADALEGWAGLELDMRAALEVRGLVFLGREGVAAPGGAGASHRLPVCGEIAASARGPATRGRPAA